jgi:hypothetical protein
MHLVLLVLMGRRYLRITELLSCRRHTHSDPMQWPIPTVIEELTAYVLWQSMLPQNQG